MAKKKSPPPPPPAQKQKAKAADLVAAHAGLVTARLTVKLDTLHLDPENARRHPEKNMAAIVGSLRQFGQVESLVVQKGTGRIIGGNGRYQAMRSLGWETCDVVEVDLDDEHATALGLVLNRTGELAEWDDAVLAEHLADLVASGFALDEVGFDAGDLDEMLRSGGDGDSGLIHDITEDAIPPPPKVPVTRLGDTWVLGEHRLMCGNSTDAAAVGALMAGRKATLIFTDPPYNIGGESPSGAADIRDSYKRLNEATWDQTFVFSEVQDNLLACLDESGSIYVCTSQHLAGDIWTWMRTWSAKYGYCVWRKSNPMPSLHKRHWTWCSELVCYATRGAHTFNFPEEGHALSVWDIEKNRSNDLHPTMKPVAVPAHAIVHSSTKGDLVVDLFNGAGSTMLACEQLGRTCYAMEVEPAFCDVTVQRWETQTKQKARRFDREGAEIT